MLKLRAAILHLAHDDMQVLGEITRSTRRVIEAYNETARRAERIVAGEDY